MIDRNAIIVGIATVIFIIFGLYYGNVLKRTFGPVEVENSEVDVVPTTTPTPEVSITPTPDTTVTPVPSI